MFLLKTLISALLIAGASEAAKRSAVVGALIASLPLTSVLALAWIYRDTRDVSAVAAFSTSVFWAVLLSLPMFLALPWLLKRGVSFVPALAASCLVAAAGYAVFLKIDR